MTTVNGITNWKHSSISKKSRVNYIENKEKMGQAQSEEYHQDDKARTIQNVSDFELNTSNSSTQDTRDSKRKGRKSQASLSSLKNKHQQHQHVRKLSDVSNRNIQLLSMKPRGERDAYADDLRCRRRSSLINLILGAPSSGPRFSDDLYSLSSHVSNFGIDFFPDVYRVNSATLSFSANSAKLETSVEECHTSAPDGHSKICYEQTVSTEQQVVCQEKRRRSSLGNLANITNLLINSSVLQAVESKEESKQPTQTQAQAQERRQLQFRKPSLTSTLASIDLTSSFEKYDKTALPSQFSRPPLSKAKESIFENSGGQEKPVKDELRARAFVKARINQSGRVLRRTGSELSLYSYTSTGSGQNSFNSVQNEKNSRKQKEQSNQLNSSNYTDKLRETKLIIILQVCLPFILAGFGNMGAGLVLHQVAQWKAFQSLPILFILLPPFVGLKGNIEMTLASRMSTLSNLNLLDSKSQWRKLFLSNLVLILSQAIGLTLFATSISTLCEFLLTGAAASSSIYGLLENATLVVLAGALATAVMLVLISSVVVSLSICVANLIQVNPDNLSTLVVALYGDVSCVLIYGLMASWMFSLKEQGLLVSPITIISCSLIIWPVLLFIAHKFKETRTITFSSIPPMMISILVSMGSGAILSMFVNRYKLIALFQPVVNGFGANLIAVQASRVSTWLWCSAIRDVPGIGDSMKAHKALGSLATFVEPSISCMSPSAKKISTEEGRLASLKRISRKGLRIFWSFYNSSPNSVAARLLLIMLIPAQTLYFFVICFLTSTNVVVITWQFYLGYIVLCLIQVFILLALCEPMMTLLMRYHFDPDVFGISLLMAMADLIGTLCLAGAFFFLSIIEDPNAAA